MKRPKFNIGDRVKTTIEDTEMSVEVQWYICSINYCISNDTRAKVYHYAVTDYPSQEYRKLFRNENNLTLVEKVQYEDE